MKTLFKILCLPAVALGLLAITGVVSASTADVLQPASQTFNEKVQINGDLEATGTISFPAGVHIGQQGTGGVTFFNGTIINDTTDDEGESNPVTFGDDIRVDGYIYRGAPDAEVNNPVRIADSLEVVGSLSVAEMASAMGFTAMTVDANVIQVEYVFNMPVATSLEALLCRQDSDLGQLTTYKVNSNNTSIMSCQKRSGSYTWVTISE